MKAEVNLQLATRYWLNEQKSTSGLYAGTNSNGSHMFVGVRGVPRFLQDTDGSVAFAGKPEFYVYQEEDESKESPICTV